jgi:hypothetical protein
MIKNEPLSNVLLAKKKRKKTKKRKKKIGGFLPLVPILTTLAALVGGLSSAAKTINQNSFNRKSLAEQQKHNHFLENTIAAKGSGLFLKPYKINGKGLKKKKKKS